MACCPDLGVAETSLSLDAAPLVAATAEVVTLWPWEPPDLAGSGPPAPTALLEDSWFSDPWN